MESSSWLDAFFFVKRLARPLLFGIGGRRAVEEALSVKLPSAFSFQSLFERDGRTVS